jgi:hypothetical protein
MINYEDDDTSPPWAESKTPVLANNRESQGCNIVEDEDDSDGYRRQMFDTNCDHMLLQELGLHRINTTQHNWSDLIANYRTM